MIDGVFIYPLKKLVDKRGSVMHMLRNDDRHFTNFGEIYFSTVHYQVVKGWKLHKRMTLNYAVPFGEIKLVIVDQRLNSETSGTVQEIILGADSYFLVTVPPLVWSGFQGTSREAALVANCADTPHDPNEVERREVNDGCIPYDWGFIQQ